MVRRQRYQAKPGTPYAVEWPEWLVCCAGCDKHDCTLISPTGECSTVAEANKALTQALRGKGNGDSLVGWTKRRGVVYCPTCSAAEGGSNGET